MKLRSLIVVIVIFLCADTAYAQYGGYRYHRQRYRPYSSYNETGKKWLKREYMSLSYLSMSLQLDTKMKINRDSNSYNGPGISVDTTIRLTKKSSSSYGAACGTFFPVAKLNDRQMFAIDWSVGFNWYSFDFGPVEYSKTDIVTAKSQYLIVDMPVILQYKSGGEVSLDPKNKMLFSIGAGFAPTLSLGGYETAAGVFFKLRPILMAEMGMHFGFAMKIRAAVYPGTIPLVDETTEGTTLPDSDGTFKVNANGSGNFVLSLILMPYSMKWGDEMY